jgi:hypothetical protein
VSWKRYFSEDDFSKDDKCFISGWLVGLFILLNFQKGWSRYHLKLKCALVINHMIVNILWSWKCYQNRFFTSDIINGIIFVCALLSTGYGLDD